MIRPETPAMSEGNSDSFPSADNGTQMPVGSSSGALSRFDLQDLENDLLSACAGLSPRDVEEELQLTTNFNLDLMAASLWEDEERERRDQMAFLPALTCPSKDNEIMNLQLDDSDRGLNVNDQVLEGLQLNDHLVSSGQLTKYFSHEDSPYLQESQDFSLNCGTYGDTADWTSTPGAWNHDGDSSQESVLWSTYDSATKTYTPDHSTSGGTFSLYKEAGHSLDAAYTHEDNADNGEFPFPNVESNARMSAVTCLDVKSSPSSKGKYFRLKTPKGYLVLKAVPLGYDSPHLQDTAAVPTSSSNRETFLGRQEVHLLADTVRLEGSSLAPSSSPGHRHTKQQLHQSLSLEDAPMKRLPGQHRKPRKFLSTAEERQHHQRQLASIRSKEQSRGKKENSRLLRAMEHTEREKNQELGHLCQSLESMRMNCHEIYQKYGTMMPSSSHHALHEYVSGRGNKYLSAKSDNFESA